MRIFEAKEEARGVFWIINNELFAFPYTDDNLFGLSKNGLTYNHKRLWKELNLKTKVPYNYYPRGRVDFDNKGKPVIWMNPNIDSSYIPDIRKEFGLRDNPTIKYDNSDHYKCYLDIGWKPDKN